MVLLYATVEQVEPVVVAVVQQSIEFALCYLEKWIGKNDDSSVQVLSLLRGNGFTSASVVMLF